MFSLASAAAVIACARHPAPTMGDYKMATGRLKHWVVSGALNVGTSQPGRGRRHSVSRDSILLAGVFSELADAGVPVGRIGRIGRDIAGSPLWRRAQAGDQILLLISLQENNTQAVLRPRSSDEAADIPWPYLTLNLTSIVSAVTDAIAKMGGKNARNGKNN